MPGARKKYNKNRSKRPRNLFLIKNFPLYTLQIGAQPYALHLKFPASTHIFKFLFQNKKQFKHLKQIKSSQKRHHTDKNT